MPRVRMKVSAPRTTFLSWAMASISISVGGSSPGMSPASSAGPARLQMRGDAAGILARGEPELGRKSMRQHHADGDALAMQQPVGIAGRLFERVAEGVAEIEQRAHAGFLLVGEHEAGLGGAGAGDGFGAGRAAGEDLGLVLLEPEEERLVVDEAVFHHLGIAGGELRAAAACRACRDRRAPAWAGGRRR